MRSIPNTMKVLLNNQFKSNRSSALIESCAPYSLNYQQCDLTPLPIDCVNSFSSLSTILSSSYELSGMDMQPCPLTSECLSYILDCFSANDSDDDDDSNHGRQENDEEIFHASNLNNSKGKKQKRESFSVVSQSSTSSLGTSIVKASFVDATSNSVMLQQQYQQQLNSNYQHSYWKLQEDEILVHYHGKYGNNWALISTHLKSRTRVEVKIRYRSLVRAAKRFWTKEQDQELLKVFAKHQHIWSDAIALEFPTRTKISVRSRIDYLTGRDHNQINYPAGSPNKTLASNPTLVYHLLGLELPTSPKAKKDPSQNQNLSPSIVIAVDKDEDENNCSMIGKPSLSIAQLQQQLKDNLEKENGANHISIPRPISFSPSQRVPISLSFSEQGKDHYLSLQTSHINFTQMESCQYINPFQNNAKSQ